MKADDIVTELNAHKEELNKFGLSLHSPTFQRFTYTYSSKIDIDIVYERTNCHYISAKIKVDETNDKFTFICNVDAKTNTKYADFQDLQYAKTYSEFKIEIIYSWLKYIKEIKHLMCQKEDMCQKLCASAARQGQVLKDFIL